MNKVQNLIYQIQKEAAEQNLKLSRWQENGPRHRCEITYILHSGDRTNKFRHMPQDSILSIRFLSAKEGKTERCAAYKVLNSMLDGFKKHVETKKWDF